MIRAGILTGNIGLHRTGVANYVDNLISYLNSLVDITTINHRNSFQYSNTHSLFPYYSCLPFNTVLWSTAVTLSSQKYRDLDLVHNPSQFPLPFSCHKRYVMTIHDITAISMPEYHTGYRTLYSKLFLKSNIHKASHLIAVSKKTKRDLTLFLEIPPEEISVVYEAANDCFHPRNQQEIIHIMQKYRINNPFILFVGTIEPRKNIPSLLAAFKKLRDIYPEYNLVIIGRNGWKYQETYMVLNNLNLIGSVIFLPNVPQEDLPALYSASSLFVLPSWYEGFGLPPLEAMQCGVPVVVSDRGSLPEIVGPKGYMVPPDDTNMLMEAMERLLTDENERKKQIQYNLNRSHLFSWKRCVKETVQVYQKVME